MRRVAALGAAGFVILAACSASEPPPVVSHTAVRPVPEPRPDWAAALPVLLPAIRACLDESGQSAVGVTKAWPIAEGLTGVRLLAPGGERTDCVASSSDGNVLLTEKVWTVSQLPGEREPLYTPVNATRPPHSTCLAVSPARDNAGGNVGWLSYDVCRQPGPNGHSARNDAAPPLPPDDGNG